MILTMMEMGEDICCLEDDNLYLPILRKTVEVFSEILSSSTDDDSISERKN